jgi:ABC-type transport system involved in cytochrome c biogenesis ATPase subunit
VSICARGADGHIGASRRKALRHGSAYATAATRDQNPLACEIECHLRFHCRAWFALWLRRCGDAAHHNRAVTATPTRMPAETALPPVLLQATDLGYRHAERLIFGPLNFSVSPGLTWVTGGDGRGKTTLLKLMAGHLPASSGFIHRRVDTCFDEVCTAATLDNTVTQVWLLGLQARYPQWDAAVAQTLSVSLGLQAHLHKPLYMLSAGSRRKAGLLAATASGAQLTLLDTPFAALDAASARVLTQLLAQARAGSQRAWVVADYQIAAQLVEHDPARQIHLGD